MQRNHRPSRGCSWSQDSTQHCTLSPTPVSFRALPVDIESHCLTCLGASAWVSVPRDCACSPTGTSLSRAHAHRFRATLADMRATSGLGIDRSNNATQVQVPVARSRPRPGRQSGSAIAAAGAMIEWPLQAAPAPPLAAHYRVARMRERRCGSPRGHTATHCRQRQSDTECSASRRRARWAARSQRLTSACVCA